MGLFDNLFRRSTGTPDEAPAEDVDYSRICGVCGVTVDDASELEDDMCSDCADEEYTGPKYCCGQIYEEGEWVCASCGEDL